MIERTMGGGFFFCRVWIGGLGVYDCEVKK